LLACLVFLRACKPWLIISQSSLSLSDKHQRDNDTAQSSIKQTFPSNNNYKN